MRGTKTTDQMEKPFQGLIVEISPPSANFRVPAPMQSVAEDDHQHFRGSSSSSQFADRSYACQFAENNLRSLATLIEALHNQKILYCKTLSFELEVKRFNQYFEDQFPS